MGLTAEEAFEIARSIIEAEVRPRMAEVPRPARAHLSQAVVAASPTLWRIYREGIRRGLLPEFEKPRPTVGKRWGLYHQIDAELRRMVLASPRPMTMRAAINQLAQACPDLLLAYDAALREERRAARRRKR